MYRGVCLGRLLLVRRPRCLARFKAGCPSLQSFRRLSAASLVPPSRLQPASLLTQVLPDAPFLPHPESLSTTPNFFSIPQISFNLRPLFSPLFLILKSQSFLCLSPCSSYPRGAASAASAAPPLTPFRVLNPHLSQGLQGVGPPPTIGP